MGILTLLVKEVAVLSEAYMIRPHERFPGKGKKI